MGLIDMNEMREKFEMLYGLIDSPQKLQNYYDFLGRGKGKTTQLVRSIPNEPIVILVHSKAAGDVIKSLIRKSRPDYDIKNVEFVVYDIWHLDKLKGIGRDIYVDNAVVDIVASNFVRSINVNYGKRKD